MDEIQNDHKVTAKLACELRERRSCPLRSSEVDWLATEQALQASQTNSNWR